MRTLNPQSLEQLRQVWDTQRDDYRALMKILFSLGFYPEFPSDAEYTKLWSFVNTGSLLNEDISQWELRFFEKAESLWQTYHRQQFSV